MTLAVQKANVKMQKMTLAEQKANVIIKIYDCFYFYFSVQMLALYYLAVSATFNRIKL